MNIPVMLKELRIDNSLPYPANSAMLASSYS